MFFDPERILAVREMIFATNRDDREKALENFFLFKRMTFSGIFKVMRGKPVNIRFLILHFMSFFLIRKVKDKS
jgi:pyruvate,orthophosphate dikinase